MYFLVGVVRGIELEGGGEGKTFYAPWNIIFLSPRNVIDRVVRTCPCRFREHGRGEEGGTKEGE